MEILKNEIIELNARKNDYTKNKKDRSKSENGGLKRGIEAKEKQLIIIATILNLQSILNVAFTSYTASKLMQKYFKKEIQKKLLFKYFSKQNTVKNNFNYILSLITKQHFKSANELAILLVTKTIVKQKEKAKIELKIKI